MAQPTMSVMEKNLEVIKRRLAVGGNMHKLYSRDLAIGYEGKTVVQNINLSDKERGLSVCDRGKWGWEIYFYEDIYWDFYHR